MNDAVMATIGLMQLQLMHEELQSITDHIKTLEEKRGMQEQPRRRSKKEVAANFARDHHRKLPQYKAPKSRDHPQPSEGVIPTPYVAKGSPK